MKTKNLLRKIILLSLFGILSIACRAQITCTVVDSFNTNIFPYPIGVAYDGTNLWTSYSFSHYIYKYSTSGLLLDSVPDPACGGTDNSEGIVFANGYLYSICYGCDTMYKTDVATKTVVASYTGMLADDRPSIAYDGMHTLYFANGADYQGSYKFDLNTNTFTPFGNFLAHGLCFIGNKLYGVDSFVPEIFEVDTATGATSNSQPYCPPYNRIFTGMTFDGTYVWQANLTNKDLYKILLTFPSTGCSDTIYTLPQSTLYFCYGSCSNNHPIYQIAGSYGAAATVDSTINWLITYDKDGPGPLTALPDSFVAGHDIHHSTNRAPWFPGFTPSYLSTFPQITPFALSYFLNAAYQDTGRALCFTPIAWDSIASGQLFELDNCFGVGQPFLKTYLKAIYADHYYSCDAGVNMLHLIVHGGLPQYNYFNGYGDSTAYTVDINGTQFTAYWNDTISVAASEQNIISISDSLSTVPGLAEGCVVYNDTLTLYPPLDLSGLTASYYDTTSSVALTVSPKPSGAMRIDFFTSEPVAAGLYVLGAQGDTLYSLYPIGYDFGVGNSVDILRSLYLYDLPLDKKPYSIVATGDDGLGWQYGTCYGLNNDGYFQVFDLATGDSLSPKLFPVGDNQCGAVGIYSDTFPNFNIQQYNKTQLSINGNPLSLSTVDSVGNATFSPSTAGAGVYQITFTYNDTKSGLCDKDTTFNVVVNLTIGINELQNNNEVMINNPVHDLLSIKTKVKTTMVQVMDITGRELINKSFTHQTSLDISSLANGVYILKLFDEHQAVIAEKKFVKN